MPTKSQPCRCHEHRDEQDTANNDAPPVPMAAQAAPAAMMHAFDSISVAPSVQRSPQEYEPYRAPEADGLPGHTAGSDTWGGIHYGAFCGPGNKPTKNGAAIDGMDEFCRQHDANYGRVGVSADSMWSMDSLVKSRDADRMLYEGVAGEMENHGGAYSPGARLYGQGVKGISGGRSGVADGYLWGEKKLGEFENGMGGAYDQASGWLGNKGSELENGVGGAYDQATGWLGSKGGQIANGVGGAYNDASGWLGSKGSQASDGISGFFDEASHWDSLGDAASGIGGAFGQASSWLGDTFSQGKKGISGAFGDATGWLGNAASEGMSGIGGAFGDATSWLGNSASQAYGGVSESAGSALDWTMNTGKEAAGGLTSAAKGVGGWLGDTAGAIGDVAVDQGSKAVKGIEDWVGSWF